MNEALVQPSLDAKKMAALAIRKIATKWQSNIVARSRIREFTGGLYSSGFLANCDCLGDGPSGAFRVGRQVVYPVDSLCDWLIKRLEV